MVRGAPRPRALAMFRRRQIRPPGVHGLKGSCLDASRRARRRDVKPALPRIGLATLLALLPCLLAQTASKRSSGEESYMQLVSLSAMLVVFGFGGLILIMLLFVTWRRYNRRVNQQKRSRSDMPDLWQAGAERVQAPAEEDAEQVTDGESDDGGGNRADEERWDTGSNYDDGYGDAPDEDPNGDPDSDPRPGVT